MPALSLRTSIILLYLAASLCLGGILAVFAAWAINSRKEQIQAEALNRAVAQGENLKQELEALIARDNLSSLAQLFRDRQLIEPPIMRARRTNGDIQFIALYSEDGPTLLFATPAEDGAILIEMMHAEQIPPALLSQIQPRQMLVQIPLFVNNRELAELRMGVSEQSILERQNRAARQIVQYAIALAAAFILLLALTFLMLWNSFQRYFKLSQQSERQERIAYVGALAGGLAHEIRNPLNSINLNLDVIREELEDPREDSGKRTHELIRLLQSETQQLNVTLSNFLTFALPKKAEFGPCDLVNILGDTISLLQADLKKIGAECVCHMPRSVIINGDSAALRQVFWNVLLNALQAMEESAEKRLSVSLEVRPGQCLVLIGDTGCGIPREDWEKAFKVFHSTRAGGSGFGLAIAKRIVADHQGEIRIAESSARGTKIEIGLPLEKAG